MAEAWKDAAAIWRQEQIPVIYRPGAEHPLLVKLPYAPGNRDWLRGEHRRIPQWVKQYHCWEVPKAWFNTTVEAALRRFGSVYVIQPFQVREKCAPACWRAQGFECECSCMGANHGSQHPSGAWRVVSETFAVQFRGKELGCRLIRRADVAAQVSPAAAQP